MPIGGYGPELERAIAVARAAGGLLRAEFHRPGGPRGSGEHADIDVVVEAAIRDALVEAFPAYGYLGEELGAVRASADPDAHVWLVDPNDGTHAFLRGYRGPSVSIGLLRAGVPVLGVVFAYCAPDDGGDLISWAEGCQLERNGRAVRRAWPSKMAGAVALLAQGADRNPLHNARLVHPMRFRPVPSIAYRLALVAAGEGDLALTRVAPVGWDYAAGHALLRAAGGELYGGAGVAVTYTAEGVSRCAPRCIGGLPAMAAVLLARDWSSGRQPSRTSEPYGLCTPRPGRAITDEGMLARAQGCLLGQLAGDALGAQVEFRAGGEIAAAYPGGLREMDDGGTWGTLAGQPTDDSELALALARSAVEYGGYDSEAAARAYAYWYESRPFDMGQTTRSALEATAAAVRAGKPAAEAALRAANRTSQANGALMRVSPLGILGAALGHGRAAEWARADAALTHPNSICLDVNAIFAETLAAVIRSGGDAESAYDYARAAADRLGVAPEISAALRAAHDDPPAAYQANQGWVLLAFQNAYYQLLHAEGTEAGIVDTVMRGGDTDTNAAIAGALLGAVYGRDSVPPQWRGRVLSCRPVAGLEGVRHPRPAAFWPVDALWLAERLLLAAA